MFLSTLGDLWAFFACYLVAKMNIFVRTFVTIRLDHHPKSPMGPISPISPISPILPTKENL